LGLSSIASSQYSITSINNTVGLYFNEEINIKVSNEKWTLLVYQDLLPFKKTIEHNDRILNGLLDTLSTNQNIT